MFTPLKVGLQENAITPDFHVGIGDLNSVSHACKATTLPTEPSLQFCLSLLLETRSDSVIQVDLELTVSLVSQVLGNRHEPPCLAGDVGLLS